MVPEFECFDLGAAVFIKVYFEIESCDITIGFVDTSATAKMHIRFGVVALMEFLSALIVVLLAASDVVSGLRVLLAQANRRQSI